MDNHPNIMIFVMDSQRTTNLGVYGYPKHTSPQLEAIAGEGMVYDNHRSSSPWCLASYASINTGKYPSSHGANIRFESLLEEYPTLAETLSRHDYSTAGFSSNSYFSDVVGTNRGFEHFEFYKANKEVDQDKGSAEMERRVLKWLDERDQEKPFFLFINSNEPHWPYWAPEPYRFLFLPEDHGYDEDALRALQKRAQTRPDLVDKTLTPEEWQLVKGLYDGETARSDGALGTIVDAMRQKEIIDNTLIIVTSDHGEDQGEHMGFISHACTLNRTVLQVPLIMRLPSVIPAGKRFSGMSQDVDFFPTILTIAGLDDDVWHGGLEGRSLVPTFQDESVREYAIAEFSPPLRLLERDLRGHELPSRYARHHFRALKSLEDQKYRFIWSSNGQDELFNMETDPGETQNLLDELPETSNMYYKKLDEWMMARPHRDYGDALNIHPIKGVKTENLRRLEQWGLLRHLHPIPFGGSDENLSHTIDRS
ncbi:MAG: sulfatase [Planctomycetota bacterium]|nr:sulfatase [Planctomycetota bacterium]